jgi:molecular chaperone HtpG
MSQPIETIDMAVNFEGLIQLLARHLYSSPEIFVRELVQNAHDSIVRRLDTEPELGGHIDIEVRPATRELVFRDNGIGMDRDDIRKFLAVIGSTGTGEARDELSPDRAYELIGQFGIGMLSAFVVAEKVVVRTRRGGNDAFAWHNSGSVTCELYVDDKDTIGTDVVLHIGEAYEWMLRPDWIRGAVVQHCDFIQFPIKVDGRGPVNAVTPPWHRDSWQSEEEKIGAYRQYLERRYPRETIFAVIPVEIDGRCRARGALYISDQRVPDVNAYGVVDIFVRRMFVRDRDNELLPPWAKFVRGLVDSPDLVPTAARDNIRRDEPAYEPLQQQLGQLIIDYLTTLAKEKPPAFAKICLWHHYHIKGMALEYDSFFDKIVEYLLFETNRGAMSLTEYLPKNPPRPEDDGRAPLYYFGFAGAAAQFYRLANANDLCVINAGMDLDEDVLYKYAQRYVRKVVPHRLDVNDDPDMFKPLDADEEATFRQLEIDMEGALRRSGVTNIAVRMRRFAPVELPAVIILTEDSESDLKLRDLVDTTWLPRELEEVARQALDHTGHRPIYLQLNATNELVRQLAGMSTQEPTTRDLMYAMYTSAVLYARNLLTQQNSEAIHRQFLRLCARTIELVEVKHTIEEERRQKIALRELQNARGAKRPDHVVLFMMTPFRDEYTSIENAVRRVFEREPYFFEVVLARDHTYEQLMRDNVRQAMARAHGFIAEISELNPNVMMELGAVLLAEDGRPTFTLRCEDSSEEIPADIKDLILVPYGSRGDADLEEQIRRAVTRDGRIKHEGIAALLENRTARFLSPTLLAELKIKLSTEDIDQILAKHHTVESVAESSIDDLVRLGLDRPDATYVHEKLTALVASA